MSPIPGSSGSSMPSFVLDALTSDGTSSTSASNLASSAVTGGPGSAAGASGTVGELVSCLMLLDALDDAKMYLLLHARAGIRQMILRSVAVGTVPAGRGVGGCGAV
jgi:hypothetical protein